MPAIPDQLRGRSWRAVALVAGRVLCSIVVLVALYYLLPLDRAADGSPLLLLAIALPTLTAVVALQVVAILRSAQPQLRAVEALAVSIPLLVLSFATTYYLLGAADASTFSEALSRTDALYFSVTVLSTVGFGDIVPTTESTRAVVTINMVVNVLVLGIGLRIILGAVRLAQAGSDRNEGPRRRDGHDRS